MLQIFLLLLPLFVLIGIGYVIARTKVASPDWVKTFSLFNYYVAFPALIFNTISATHFSWDIHGKIIIFQIIFGIGLMILTWVVCTWLRVTEAMRNTLTICMYFGNAGYIGIPALQLVFGTEAAAEGAVILAVMIIITFTLGVAMLEASRHGRIQAAELIRGVGKNPLLWAVVAGSVVALFDIALVQPLTKLIDLLAAAAVPTMLVDIGIFLALNQPSRAIVKQAFQFTVFRMILVPVVFGVLLWLAPDSEWLRTTFTQMSMPVALTVFAFAEIYPMNKAFVSTVVAFTTVSAIITLPIVMWISTFI